MSEQQKHINELKLALVVTAIGFFVVVIMLLIEQAKAPETPVKVSSVAVEPRTVYISIETLLDAIEQVESGGKADAVGDNGNAVGSFQIWKIYVDDVNRINKINHKDRYSAPIYYFYYERENPYCSRYMVKIYLEHYATKERIGRKPTLEDMVRIHNGGPNGWKKESTKPYWEKVKARLEL